MRLALLYPHNKEERIPRLKEFFDAHLIQTEFYELNEEKENLPFETLDLLLNDSDALFVLGSEDVFQSHWLCFLFGAMRYRKDDLFFYINKDDDLEMPEWLAEYRSSRSLIDISHYYLNKVEEWDIKVKQKVARARLEESNIEISSYRFIQAIKIGDRFLTGLFLEAGYSAAMKDENGVPLVCIASREGHLKILSALLSAGGEVDVVAEDRGNTALMDAAANGDINIVKHLIDNGANIEMVSKNGQTALILATGNGKLEVGAFLIQQGADYNRKDLLGMSSLKYCELYHHQELLELIESLENSQS